MYTRNTFRTIDCACHMNHTIAKYKSERRDFCVVVVICLQLFRQNTCKRNTPHNTMRRTQLSFMQQHKCVILIQNSPSVTEVQCICKYIHHNASYNMQGISLSRTNMRINAKSSTNEPSFYRHTAFLQTQLGASILQ